MREAFGALIVSFGIHGQFQMGWESFRPMDCVVGFKEVFFFSSVNVHKLMRVAIISREPAAVHLHHDFVALFKSMELVPDIKGYWRYFAGY